MGCNYFARTCSTNSFAPAPNPDPSRWELIEKRAFKNAFVLKVRYFDATNFEGIKVMVYLGEYFVKPSRLDPHFADDDNSPIARFKPDAMGWRMAIDLAKRISEDPFYEFCR